MFSFRWTAMLLALVVTVCIACGSQGNRGDAPPAASGGSGARESSKDDALAAPKYVEGPPPGLSATLAFQSDREGRTKIYLLDVASGRLTQLTHGRDHHDEEPAWSPDGDRIAFSTTRFDTRTYDIAVMNADGSDVRRVTMDPAWERDPDWLPDGAGLVFTRESDGPSAIYRVWLVDGRVERVSRTLDRALMPAVSPDGQRVAFTVGTVDGFQIFVTDLRSGDERQVTHVADGAIRPSWSPDGRRLIFTRLGQGPSHVETASLDEERIGSIVADPTHWVDDGRAAPAAHWMAVAFSPTPYPKEYWKLAVVVPASRPTMHRLTSGRGNDRSPAWKP